MPRGIPMGVLRVATAPPHPALASDTRRAVFWCICWFGGIVKLGGLARSTIGYGAQWVQQDHADLNTLCASHTHQENTPSYSRRQEMGLAVVEQYSIKQMSVLFQSRYIRGWRTYAFSPPAQAAGTLQGDSDSSIFSLSVPLSCSIPFLISYRPRRFQGFCNCRGRGGIFKTVSDEIPSELCLHVQRKKCLAHRRRRLTKIGHYYYVLLLLFLIFTVLGGGKAMGSSG